MQKKAETIFAGKWRSYKIFKPSGDIKLHTYNQFKEFTFSEDSHVTIKNYNGPHVETIVKMSEWKFHFKDHRHLLEIPDHSLFYEVITVNHTVMVLTDSASLNKIFFAREAHWHEYIKTNTVTIL